MARSNDIRVIVHKWSTSPQAYLLAGDGSGTCGLTYERDLPFTFMHNLVVDESARGRGLGRAFVQKAIELSKAAGYKRMRCFADCPEWTQEWYGRLGAKCVGVSQGGFPCYEWRF